MRPPGQGSPPLPVDERPSSLSSTLAPMRGGRGHGGDPVGFLDSEFGQAVGAAVALRRKAAAMKKIGNSSIIAGTSSGGTSMALRAEWPTRRSATGSPARARAGWRSEVAAHLAQQLEQAVRIGFAPMPVRVTSEPGRSARRRRGRRRTRVARDSIAAATSSASPRRRMSRSPACRRLLDLDVGSEQLQHPLAMVAGGTGGDDLGHPGVLRAASRSARLDLAEATSSPVR
jgi:hypothetical protein